MVSTFTNNYIFFFYLRMPYKLRKAPKRDLYWVVGIDGTKHSKEPLPRDRAEAQMKALYMAMRQKKGAGWFSNLFKPITSVASTIGSVARTTVGRVVDVAHGVRRDFSPSIRKFLAKFGKLPIAGIVIRRDPIGSLINGAINAITLGAFDPAKKANNFDKLFHLSMECYLNPKEMDSSMRVIVEKNEVINITPTERKREKDSQQMRLSMNSAKSNTLNGILGQAKEVMGDNFFLYDGFKNNCQDFIWNIVQANGQMTPELDKFIKQDVAGVAKQLPSYTAPLMNAITDLGGIVNVALQGQGGWKAGGTFKRQLEKAGVSPVEYLKEARAKAKHFGLAYKHLGFSDDDKHKLQIPNESGSVVRFGSVGLGDHILYKLSGEPTADDHQKRYLARATKIKGDWKKDRYSPNNLAIHILW